MIYPRALVNFRTQALSTISYTSLIFEAIPLYVKRANISPCFLFP